MKYILSKIRQNDFVSSSGETPEIKEFSNKFQKKFADFIKPKGCKNLKINKGHFYLSGFLHIKIKFFILV